MGFSNYLTFRKLFVHNIELNGLKATIYPFNLTASRYLEYSGVLYFLASLYPGDLVLEVGCGHSILPSYWEKLKLNVVVVDINIESLRWQISKREKNSDKIFQAVQASGTNLPFREKVFSAVSCVSVIEHFPVDSDEKAALEIGLVLKNNGMQILTFPMTNKRSYFITNLGSGIPPLLTKIFRSSLDPIFKRLKIDRSGFYFERVYSLLDMQKRIIALSGCSVDTYSTFHSGVFVKAIHGRIVPAGMLSVLEYILARFFMFTTKSTTNMDGIILKLKKES